MVLANGKVSNDEEESLDENTWDKILLNLCLSLQFKLTGS
jgi:hypothetical protein